MVKSVTDMCTPAQLYLAMSLITTIGFSLSKIHFAGTLWHLILNIIWTYFLSMLCDRGFTEVSWFLVLFPFILTLSVVFAFLYAMSHKKIESDTTTAVTTTAATTTAATTTAATTTAAGDTAAGAAAAAAAAAGAGNAEPFGSLLG